MTGESEWSAPIRNQQVGTDRAALSGILRPVERSGVEVLRRVVTSMFYPVMLVLPLWATYAGMAAGYPPTAVVMSVMFLAALPILVAQRVLPAEARWKALPRDYGLDILHGVATTLAAEGYRAVTIGLMTGAALWIQNAVGASLWPVDLPIWSQLVIALIIGDFGNYWVHRVCHEHPVAWRVHAMHHSSERLYVMASARNHPMNAILAYGGQLLPLTLLGAPSLVIGLLSVYTAVNGMLQHANVEMRTGVLNWVLSTADLHRWHHSADMEESNSNYGGNLVLWDVVFGTRHCPEGSPEEVGLGDMKLPENFFAHLASPFVLQRWSRPELSDAIDAP